MSSNAFAALATRAEWHPEPSLLENGIFSRVKWHLSGEQYLAGPDLRQTYTTAIQKLGGTVTTSLDDFTIFLTDTRVAMGRSKNVLCCLAAGGVSPQHIVYRHTPPW